MQSMLKEALGFWDELSRIMEIRSGTTENKFIFYIQKQGIELYIVLRFGKYLE
jgi:hypothetical protein